MVRFRNVLSAPLLLSLLALGMAACTPAAPGDPPPPGAPPATGPVVYGDSLLWEAGRYIDPAVLKVNAFPGTAPCDWYDQIRWDVASTHPSRVLLVFSGNAGGTGCMAGVDPGPAGETAVADRYQADLDAIRAAVAPTPVLWVRTPTKGPGNGNGVQSLPADITDAAELVAPGGAYAQRLPAEADETGEADGMVPVRNPDGVHFCPDPTEASYWSCPVDSWGARRFGRAIAATP